MNKNKEQTERAWEVEGAGDNCFLLSLCCHGNHGNKRCARLYALLFRCLCSQAVRLPTSTCSTCLGLPPSLSLSFNSCSYSYLRKTRLIHSRVSSKICFDLSRLCYYPNNIVRSSSTMQTAQQSWGKHHHLDLRAIPN